MKKLMITISVLLVGSAMDVDAMKKNMLSLAPRYQSKSFVQSHEVSLFNEIKKQQIEVYGRLHLLLDQSLIMDPTAFYYIRNGLCSGGLNIKDLNINSILDSIHVLEHRLQNVHTNEELADIRSKLHYYLEATQCESFVTQNYILQKLSNAESVSEKIFAIKKAIHTELDDLQRSLLEWNAIKERRDQLISRTMSIKSMVSLLLNRFQQDQSTSLNCASMERVEFDRSICDMFAALMRESFDLKRSLLPYSIDTYLEKHPGKDLNFFFFGLNMSRKTSEEVSKMRALAAIDFISRAEEEFENSLTRLRGADAPSNDEINYMYKVQCNVELFMKTMKADGCFFRAADIYIPSYMRMILPIMIEVVGYTNNIEFFRPYVKVLTDAAERYISLLSGSSDKSKDGYLSSTRNFIELLKYITPDMSLFFQFLTDVKSSYIKCSIEGRVDAMFDLFNAFITKHDLEKLLPLFVLNQKNDNYQENFINSFSGKDKGVFGCNLIQRCQPYIENILSSNAVEFSSFADKIRELICACPPDKLNSHFASMCSFTSQYRTGIYLDDAVLLRYLCNSNADKLNIFFDSMCNFINEGYRTGNYLDDIVLLRHLCNSNTGIVTIEKATASIDVASTRKLVLQYFMNDIDLKYFCKQNGFRPFNMDDRMWNTKAFVDIKMLRAISAIVCNMKNSPIVAEELLNLIRNNDMQHEKHYNILVFLKNLGEEPDLINVILSNYPEGKKNTAMKRVHRITHKYGFIDVVLYGLIYKINGFDLDFDSKF